jgi:hypothetical protein
MQIVVRQISGLGNQLFQYAAGRYYAKRYQATMRMALDPPHMAVSHGHPRPFLLSHFCITAPSETETAREHFLLSRKPLLQPVIATLNAVMRTQVYSESTAQRYTFVGDLPLRRGVETLYLAGYWQSWEMVAGVAEELRVDLAFRSPAEGRNAEVLRQIQATAEPVSLHIRRGDYTLAAEGNIALQLGYYLGGIDYFRARLQDPTFFVFSDDIAWATANLPAGISTVFVDHNDAVTSHEDLRLMSACRHHIIANSTFSWWGAWMNPREDKMVYAPKYWHLKADSYYPGLLPPEWMLAE